MSPVCTAVRSELVAGSTAFALDLFHALSREDDNLFFSPYSILSALAMTYMGARGETEIQMEEALRFTLPQSVLHTAFHALDSALMQHASSTEGVQLRAANALWGQLGYPFLSGFLDVLIESYNAPLRQTDFVGAPEEARGQINDWVSDETDGKIEALMKPGSMTPDTRLVLANAIYFKGTWKLQFDPQKTGLAPFHRLDGSQVSVPMMRMQGDFRYTQGAGFQAIELPYAGDTLSMVILLPGEGTFEDFQIRLNRERLRAILGSLGVTTVQLAMPKFELTSEFSLAGALAQLGMVDAFTGAADFSGMDGTRDLFIDQVVHKAYVSVNEEGTEAAAGTGVWTRLSLPTVMTIDRPFVFLIREIETGAILFMGREIDPTDG